MNGEQNGGAQTIGLIGLGAIGMATAHRLLTSGHRVLGYRRGDKEVLRSIGGEPANSIAEVAEQCETILLALPDAPASRGVVDQLRADAPRTIIDLTSMSPAQAVALADMARGSGHAYLEAPVSGVPKMVRDHQATLLVSGKTDAFETNRILLERIAARVLYVGAPGGASAVKSAAVLMIAVNTLGVAEALALVESYGVRPDVAIEALKQGPAASSALSFRGPLMAARSYPPSLGSLQGFRNLVTNIEGRASTPTAMLGRVGAYLDQAIAAGFGDHDMSVVYEQLAPSSGNLQNNPRCPSSMLDTPLNP